MACSVSLVSQSSRQACVSDVNFGCYNGEDKMYVANGCYGLFACNGVMVRCGVHHWPPLINCTCVEAVRRSTSKRPYSRFQLGHALASVRLDSDQHHRFEPRSLNETLSAIFTWWNILDRMMATGAPKHHYAMPSSKQSHRDVGRICDAPCV